MKVTVRRKKRVVKPTDLRSDAMLIVGKKNRKDLTPHEEGQRDEQEEEGNDRPSGEIDGNSVNLLFRIGRGSIGLGNARARDQQSREGEPESTIGRECWSQKYDYQRKKN